MSSETLLKTSSSFLSHLVVDTPSAGGRLTPSFFNSIFNDGMNPFDESFTALAAGSPGCSGNALETNSIVGKMKQSPLSSDKISVMLPSIETRPIAESDLLRRRPLSPLSPPISPDQPDTMARSPVLSNSRSPSPFTYSNPFLSSPSPSASPITSPDEPESSGNTPVIKQEEPSTPPLLQNKPRRRTVCAADSREMGRSGHMVSKNADKAGASPCLKSFSNNTASSIESEAKQAKARSKSAHQIIVAEPQQHAKSGNRFVSKQALDNEVQAPRLVLGRKRKNSEVELLLEDEDGDDLLDDDPNNANKRARFLERNRIAASKCRKKKKLMNQRLEEKSRLLHQHNRYLNQLVSSLKSDVLRLKQCLLVHHNCEDEPIKRYLQCEAGKVFNPKESTDKILPPILKSEPKSSPDNLMLLDELEKDRIGNLNNKWTGMGLRTREFDVEFHSFQEVESAALGRLGKPSDLSCDDELKMLFGDEMDM